MIYMTESFNFSMANSTSSFDDTTPLSLEALQAAEDFDAEAFAADSDNPVGVGG